MPLQSPPPLPASMALPYLSLGHPKREMALALSRELSATSSDGGPRASVAARPAAAAIRDSPRGGLKATLSSGRVRQDTPHFVANPAAEKCAWLYRRSRSDESEEENKSLAGTVALLCWPPL